jgi:hypothetical protein
MSETTRSRSESLSVKPSVLSGGAAGMAGRSGVEPETERIELGERRGGRR